MPGRGPICGGRGLGSPRSRPGLPRLGFRFFTACRRFTRLPGRRSRRPLGLGQATSRFRPTLLPEPGSGPVLWSAGAPQSCPGLPRSRAARGGPSARRRSWGPVAFCSGRAAASAAAAGAPGPAAGDAAPGGWARPHLGDPLSFALAARRRAACRGVADRCWGPRGSSAGAIFTLPANGGGTGGARPGRLFGRICERRIVGNKRRRRRRL